MRVSSEGLTDRPPVLVEGVVDGLGRRQHGCEGRALLHHGAGEESVALE